MVKTNITQKRKKEEAIRRMEKLNLPEEAVNGFREKDVILIKGVQDNRFLLTGGPLLEELRKIEKEHNILFYIGVRSHSNLGVTDSFLFVGNNQNAWNMEYAELEKGCPISYTVNHTDGTWSEFGPIGIETDTKTRLKRTW